MWDFEGPGLILGALVQKQTDREEDRHGKVEGLQILRLNCV